jgi:hypothetical protein
MEPTETAPRRRGLPVAAAAGVALVTAGAALLAAAAGADGPWFERHVLLPYYFVRPPHLAVAARALLAGAGALLLAAGPRAARGLGRRGARLTPGALARLALALAAALVASEVVLRLVQPPEPRARWPRWEFKVGVPHPRYGWAARPGQARTLVGGGRAFTYAVAADGRRARLAGDRRDDGRATLIVTGESIAAGFGLEYDETFAARAGRALGLEVVDVAEGGYAADQAYLRAADALPGISRPAAVISVFVPVELGRILRDDRPRLTLDGAGALVLEAPARGLWGASRLRDVFYNRWPVAGNAALARALATTGAALRATARAARARGAAPLFVIPSLGPPRPLDAHPEAAIVRALFADAGLPFVLVDLGPADVLGADGHPSPAGARRIADAVVAALRPRLPAPPP